ncbi:Pyrophosphatase ppaX [Slackia heliotrinireducens]|uniref:Tyrosine-protein kinase PtkA n=1 Tax=Slackia heliotrinireducens (strain ATCC 29202 / DSM 20476 / NCTC 11029 / RHS 1) TaxID=471855 RepID=C7N6G8_SLAHD|nr:HAD-IA family hydrolase [Slackia heliotrinireducens]ACV22503.1 haloacid dehalogenase superfamily enzyme, subfamily IA [Slackia heliotrinireducens DSM 20476]VEH00923.1 Pyrophosphatase ppaX [Slackia heliotrinireducens]
MILKAALFDNDGTLVDSEELILSSFRYATKSVLGEALPDEVLRRKVGQPLRTQMADFTPDVDKREELFRVYQEFNAREHDRMIRLFPDVANTLGTMLQRGLRLGVVTSKLSENCLQNLSHLGIDGYFECIVAPDNCPLHKPDPGPVLEGAKLLGARPEQCVYVGDSPYDIAAGRDAGCTTIAVTYGVFSREDLKPERPDYFCDSFAELLSVLDGIVRRG